MSDTIGFTNALIHSTSPYLLQHAHNPVNWEPWSDDAFRRAKAEQKLVLVSIGYSSCHWCHVMEHESFENEMVAKIMNGHFICIKVDREERPDIDQYYIEAANLMHGRAGWPLNAFTLPDKRPIFVGTYFPKDQWMGILQELASNYKDNPEKFTDYADKLEKGLEASNLVPDIKPEVNFSNETLDLCYKSFENRFDKQNGGLGQAPKFPMPDDYLFLFRYAYRNGKQASHALLTLDRMSKGGIYDQIGGGFSRYSVDESWKAPHFEKMLYDNAQLIGLYSVGYKITGSELYKQVVYDTIEFVSRELTAPEGGFYSALDADSEGVEGKYYVWTEKEINSLFPENPDLIKAYFGIGREGLWEHGNNILVQAHSIDELAKQFNKSTDEVKKIITEAKQKLLQARNTRIRPALDDKVLLSWNALMIKGLIEAYTAFGEKSFLKMASECLHFIGDQMKDGLNLLHSWRNGEANIPGFLDDFAFYIQSLIVYYQATFSDVAVQEALWFTEKVIREFSDPNGLMFYFTSAGNTELSIRNIETQDNVIASANSVMAHNLFYLGLYYDVPEFTSRAQKMLSLMTANVEQYGPYYANWALLMCDMTGKYKEVAVVGPSAMEYAQEIEKQYLPEKIMAGSINDNVSIPILQNRYQQGKTLIYICENNACLRPLEDVQEALTEMKK